MSYQLATLDASLWDQAVGALRGAVSGTVSQAAASAAAGAVPELKAGLIGVMPELKATVVGAVKEVLPETQKALSNAMDDSLQPVIIAFAVLSLFTLGSVGLMFLQYKRLGKCCPTR